MLLENKCNNLFEEVSKMNYSWMDDLKNYIANTIECYQTAMRSESELDNNTYLANYDYLYTCFKKNEETEELFAQYEVLKYLRVHMIIKCLKYVLGEWTFTDTDKEMLDRLVEIQNTERCMPRKLKFKSVDFNIEKVFEGMTFRNYALQYYEITNVTHAPADERFCEAFYLEPFMEWISIMLKVTTGKGMTWYDDGDWNKQCQLKDLTKFFEFQFSPTRIFHGEFVLVDEQHTINCKQYEQDKNKEQASKAKNTFMFNLGCAVASLYKEGDRTPFNIRNKLATYAANKCFKHMINDKI